jgi:hypothetical protein
MASSPRTSLVGEGRMGDVDVAGRFPDLRIVLLAVPSQRYGASGLAIVYDKPFKPQMTVRCSSPHTVARP